LLLEEDAEFKGDPNPIYTLKALNYLSIFLLTSLEKEAKWLEVFRFELSASCRFLSLMARRLLNAS